MTRSLSRQQVLRWREAWSVSDLDLIEHALGLLPEQDYYEPNSAQYLGARVAGQVAVYIAPGYVYWPKATWCTDLDSRLVPAGLKDDASGDTWYALSTFMKREGSARRFEELSAPCPKCFQVPSVAGACGCY